MSKGLFKVGAARVEITPPLSVPYLAWNPRHQPFRGVHDPLFARALVVEAAGRRAAVVSADLIGFADTLLGPGPGFVHAVRRRIEEWSGIAASSVMLAATHAHATPDTLDFLPLREEPGALEWLELLIERIADTVTAAGRNMFDATLFQSRVPVPGVSINRRHPTRPVHDELLTLTFRSPDQSRRITLLHFRCHPVIVQVQDQVSADYVGALTRSVEAAGAEQCLFLQGASGDINPACGDSRDFADVQRTADILAAAVQEKGTPQPALLEVAHKHISVGPHQCALQSIQLGGTTLVAIPGEPFDELTHAIAPAVPVACANGYLGYFVPRHEWPAGGYEVGPGEWQQVGPGAHEEIVAAITRTFVQSSDDLNEQPPPR